MTDFPRDLHPDPLEGLSEAIQIELLSWPVSEFTGYIKDLVNKGILTDEFRGILEYEVESPLATIDQVIEYLNAYPEQKNVREVAAILVAAAIMMNVEERLFWESELSQY